jgi:ATP-dependent protease ClpP protease subunit
VTYAAEKALDSLAGSVLRNAYGAPGGPREKLFRDTAIYSRLTRKSTPLDKTQIEHVAESELLLLPIPRGQAIECGPILILHLDGVLAYGAIDAYLPAIQKADTVSIFIHHGDGGAAKDAVRLYRALAGKKVSVTVVSHCCSAFTIILCAGRERKIVRGAHVQVHQPQDCRFGSALTLLCAGLRLLPVWWHQWRILGRRCGYWRALRWMLKDHVWFDDNEALAAGLITEIIAP